MLKIDEYLPYVNCIPLADMYILVQLWTLEQLSAHLIVRCEKYHIQMLVRWLFFSDISYCDNRERVFMLDYDTKEKEHQNTRQSDKYSGATPSRTNQIGLFRCSFYYLLNGIYV
jgi:hypothetical protein